MKIHRWLMAGMGVMAMVILLVGCKKDEIANPASVYCEEQGGKLEIRKGEDGEAGYCLFDYGSECEEWAFLRGECKPGDSLAPVGMPNPASMYCEEQGGKLEIRKGADGEAGYCMFSDGSECEEWAFMNGECKPASTP